jgi:Trk K+ transport system NAD-binding subunit
MSDNALWIILQKLRTPLLVIIVTYSIAILGMVLIPGLDDKGNVYHLTFFDAFYFVSYMASTIGFGESPYDFTYQQKLWVSFCIYLTVVGWFYGVGALVSAVTDRTLKFELMRSSFRKKVRDIKNDFVIILGYSYVNSEIIKKFHEVDIEVVLIEKNEEKVNHFLLEESSRDVPIMVGDGIISDSLEDAGIRKRNCKAIVSLFKDEEKNLRISILTKFLNSKVKVIAKATFDATSKSIKDTDIATVINPFEVFAKRVDISLTSPHVLMLENWIYKNSDLNSKVCTLPEGKYIVCGYGRLGRELQRKFDKHNIDYVFIDEKRTATIDMIQHSEFIHENPDDKEVLLKAGIKEATCLIIGTKNDIKNLSIMITAKKLNPDIYLVSRENTIQEISIFQAADIDWIFMIERILINKTSLALTKPLHNYFLMHVLKKDEIWAERLVRLLRKRIGDNPRMMALKINEEESYAIYHEILDGREVNIDVLRASLSNRERKNIAIPLMIHRDGENILLPRNMILQIEDHLLFACDSETKEEIELIASNIYELHYAKYGKEKEVPFLTTIFGHN